MTTKRILAGLLISSALCAAVAVASNMTYIVLAVRNDHKENAAVRNAILGKLKTAYADKWSTAEIAASWVQMTNETEGTTYWVFCDSDYNLYGSRRFGGAFDLATKLAELEAGAPEGVYFRLTVHPRKTITDPAEEGGLGLSLIP